MNRFEVNGEIVWRPTPELIAQSNLKRFMDRHGVASMAALQERSASDVSWFWKSVLEDLDIQFHRPWTKVLDCSRGAAWAQWCVGGGLNIVHNCLDKYAGTPTDTKPAIVWEDEDGGSRSFSYAGLRDQVNCLAGALRSGGLGKGDVIGVFMPMTPESVVAMLAIIKIGGVFLPLFSGYGASAIVSRLRDAEAKALFTADGCKRRGKVALLKSIADEAAAQVPSLRQIIVLKHLGAEVAWNEARDCWWHELMSGLTPATETEPTNAEDPMMLLYTSGTTGKPKGAVHTHCGFPIKAAQDMSHGLDLHEDETLFWVTDMGWMMGPWLVFGTLLLGATMMICDGALDHPGPDRLWELCARHRVTALGVSPTLVRRLILAGEEPVRKHPLPALRKFGSTGEAWDPESWLWLFNVVGGGRLPIINYSGGTEISGGILMGNVLAPLKPCAFSGPVPGMAADVVDGSGNPIRGGVGELVIREPWIGMTRGFWRDPQRYFDTYWLRIPGLWVHGDWAAVDRDGFWYILGRSDDTLKVAGKRVGPAEVESVLVAQPGVSEAAAIGVPDPLKGETIVCFCVLKPGHKASRELGAALNASVARELGKPLAPRETQFVSELPRTRNGKIMRRVIRSAYLGENPGDISSLENPGAIEEIRATAPVLERPPGQMEMARTVVTQS